MRPKFKAKQAIQYVYESQSGKGVKTYHEWKRERLKRAGADVIIPDYRNLDDLEAYLFA